MPKRSSRKNSTTDINVLAGPIVEQATDEEQPFLHDIKLRTNEKNIHAVALGSLGGKKGGPARAAKLTPQQRKEMARKAAQARWAKRGG